MNAVTSRKEELQKCASFVLFLYSAFWEASLC